MQRFLFCAGLALSLAAAALAPQTAQALSCFFPYFGQIADLSFAGATVDGVPADPTGLAGLSFTVESAPDGQLLLTAHDGTQLWDLELQEVN